EGEFPGGCLLFSRGAPFLSELEAELLRFPQGKTDDQVDSITQALAYQDSGYDASLSWVLGKPRKPLAQLSCRSSKPSCSRSGREDRRSERPHPPSARLSGSGYD